VIALPRRLAIVCAVVAASIPAVVFYGEFALTDAVLAPLFTAWILTLHATVTASTSRRQAWLAAACGVLVGALWLVHVRSIIILLTHVAAFGFLWLRGRLPRRVVVHSWWGIFASLGIDVAARLVVGNAIVMTGQSPSGTLRTRLFTPFGLVHTINWAIGQIWYLSISTLGLATVGGVVAIAWLRRRESGTTARTVFLASLAVVTVGIAFFSAATLPDDGRINLYAYARYVAFTAPLWIVVAVAGLVPVPAGADQPARRPVSVARVLAAATVVVLGSAYVVVSYSNGTPASTAFIAFDAPEASVMTWAWDHLRIAAVTAVALAALMVLTVALSSARTRLVALGATLALCVAAMPAITAHAAAPMSRQFAPGVWLRDLGVTPADRVAADNGVLWWAMANVQWEVYWAPVAQFDSTTTAPPRDATVVVAPFHSPNHRRTWDGTAEGWHWIAIDTKSGTAIWRRT
jgi:hypothetical protein